MNRRRFSCIVLGYTFVCCTLALPVHASGGLSDNEKNIIDEAVQQIRIHALVPPKSTRAMTNDILRSYANSLDNYSDYLTSTEYTAYLESTNSDYFGVQMDIQKKNGRIYLFPFTGGIAEKNNIQPGDELIAINGSPVYGKSVFLVGSSIRGAEGLTVQLTIRSGKGIPRVLTLRRQRTHYASVRSTIRGKTLYIQIARFAKNTEELLHATLNRTGKDDQTILIDLRRNQGGSLRVARQCADLFLKPDTVLFRLRFRDKIQDIVAAEDPVTKNNVVLLQDNNTASAAEAFIAALVSNGRAISVGEQSYGKGLAQRFLPLSDGSALLLTYAEILTPDNFAYNNYGLEPGVKLSPELINADFLHNDSLSGLLKFIKVNQQ